MIIYLLTRKEEGFMPNVKKSKKKRNYWILIPIIFLVLVITLLIVGVVHTVLPSEERNLYGNRLEGIEKYPIKDETINSIKDTLKENKKVISVDYNLKGKLIDFIITIDKDLDKVSAKSLTNKILEIFEDEIENFYDIQVFIKTNEEVEGFPIIGSKHAKSANFFWSNN